MVWSQFFEFFKTKSKVLQENMWILKRCFWFFSKPVFLRNRFEKPVWKKNRFFKPVFWKTGFFKNRFLWSKNLAHFLSNVAFRMKKAFEMTSNDRFEVKILNIGFYKGKTWKFLLIWPLRDEHHGATFDPAENPLVIHGVLRWVDGPSSSVQVQTCASI